MKINGIIPPLFDSKDYCITLSDLLSLTLFFCISKKSLNKYQTNDYDPNQIYSFIKNSLETTEESIKQLSFITYSYTQLSSYLQEVLIEIYYDNDIIGLYDLSAVEESRLQYVFIDISSIKSFPELCFVVKTDHQSALDLFNYCEKSAINAMKTLHHQLYHSKKLLDFSNIKSLILATFREPMQSQLKNSKPLNDFTNDFCNKVNALIRHNAFA